MLLWSLLYAIEIGSMFYLKEKPNQQPNFDIRSLDKLKAATKNIADKQNEDDINMKMVMYGICGLGLLMFVRQRIC